MVKQASWENRGEELLLLRKEGRWEGLFLTEVHWKRARVQDGDSFSLAECGGFLLVGLLLGKEKMFLLLGHVK